MLAYGSSGRAGELERSTESPGCHTWSVTAYDVIGDIHGDAQALSGLLNLLGWTSRSGSAHQHDERERQVVFVGDLIDRGSDHRSVLSMVKAMTDAGTAQVVMGNHEFNAICFATQDPVTSRPLREHSEKNRKQHREFLEQLGEVERDDWIAWFKTLPLWLDLDGLRIVHACWHNESIELLRSISGSGVNSLAPDIETWVCASTDGDPIWQAVEILLKGPEINLARYGLPNFVDSGGNRREDARAAWWRAGATTQAELIDLNAHTKLEDGSPYPPLPDAPCDPQDQTFSYSGDVPVIYGHHWRQWEPTEHLDWTTRTACVDFSAAKGGPLVAYTWRGESVINPSHYVRYPAGD